MQHMLKLSIKENRMITNKILYFIIFLHNNNYV